MRDALAGIAYALALVGVVVVLWKALQATYNALWGPFGDHGAPRTPPARRTGGGRLRRRVALYRPSGRKSSEGEG